MSSSLILRQALRNPAARSALRSTLQVRKSSAQTSGIATPGAEYVPGGPIYKGTVNDPTTFPPPNRTAGSYHWAFERLLSAAMIPATGAAFAGSTTAYPALDALFGVVLVMHSHIGFDSMVVDYLHPRKFPVIGPIATWGLRAATVACLVGVYQFNTNDVGLTELIARVWHA